jgi:hypothetical protein
MMLRRQLAARRAPILPTASTAYIAAALTLASYP